MDWLNNILGKKEPKPRQTAPEPGPLPPSVEPEQEAPEISTFTEIDGSPVPGLTLRQVLRGHGNWIGRIAWSPDGAYLASPSEDQTIRIWEARSWRCMRTLQGHAEVNSVAWSPDGRRLASASDDAIIRLWDAASSQVEQTLQGHSDRLNSVAWSPDGRRLASASRDNTIRLWDAASGQVMQTLQGHTDGVNSVAWSPDSRRLASASGDKTIRLWDTARGQAVQTLQGHTRWVYGVAWSPDGQRLVSASGDKTIRLWDTARGQALQVLEGHSGGVNYAAFSADGHWLASKGDSNDNNIRLWRGDTWACAAVLNEPASGYWPSGIAFHHCLPVLATLGEKDTIIRIWELDEAILLGQAQEAVRYTTAKVVLVGDSGVGKTGLGWRLAHGEFKEHASTHGQQFWAIPQLGLARPDGVQCEAVLWDLAGQHVYRQVHSIFLENVAAALVLFDPSNRQEPLKGAQFWLEQLKGKGQLPPAILVGARADRGAPALSQAELEQFCQRYAICGGYVSTSALSGEGLEALLEKLKAQIPWEQMTATVTTVTFKRIKDYVLALKEKPERQGVLVNPAELRVQLEQTPEVYKTTGVWEFTDSEMMTAVGHLETHGYVTILRSSAGEQHILLTPDLLVNLAASIMLLADKNPRELGAVSERALLHGQFPFDELKGLAKAEQQVLLDAAVLRFLEHNICFRETYGDDTLLIFPGLIKQKRPLQDDLPATDDISYAVRGRVENLYAMLVVLLGYTPSFVRINQWQNQAQYEMGAGEICGFRLIEEREGELELVLYYSAAMPAYGRAKFQELFEQFIYQREVEVTRFPPVICPNGHRQERATVVKRVRENKRFVFCEECGEKTNLPSFDQPQTIGIGASPWLQREEAAARLRSAYEVALTRVKSYRRSWATPRAYLSRLPEQAAWADKLCHDLNDAGVYVVEQVAQVQPEDAFILLDTPAYRHAFKSVAPTLVADIPLIQARLGKKGRLISLALSGPAVAHDIQNCKLGSFCDKTHYPIDLFNLVLELYAIPFDHAGFAPERQKLHTQWEQTVGRLAQRVDDLNTGEGGEVGEDTSGATHSGSASHPVPGPRQVEAVSGATHSGSVPHPAPGPRQADVAILTILPEEYEAVCGKIANLQPDPPRREHANLYAWKVGQVGAGAKTYSVAVGMMGRAGTLESALATRDAVERWNPQYVFFVGIAGGLKSLEKGDVVIADVIHGYEYGKIEKTFIPRSNWTYKTDIGLLNGAVAHIASKWREGVTARPPQPVELKAVAGEIASGDKVVDNPDQAFFAKVLKTWPKIIAVEMEGAGAGNAIEQTQALGKAVSYLMIRGISDLPRPPADEPQAGKPQGTAERDAWKACAADSAAAFTVSFIASGLPLPPR